MKIDAVPRRLPTGSAVFASTDGRTTHHPPGLRMTLAGLNDRYDFDYA